MENNNLNLTEKQEFELMYKFFMHYRSLSDDEKMAYALHGNDIDSRTQMFAFVSDMRGYNAFPTVVEDVEYDNLENALELYHGWKDSEHAKNFLSDFNYHIGRGAYGSGFYLTESRDNADYFTQNNVSKTYSRDRVMPLKIVTTNGIDSQTLYRLCYKMETGKTIKPKRFVH